MINISLEDRALAKSPFNFYNDAVSIDYLNDIKLVSGPAYLAYKKAIEIKNTEARLIFSLFEATNVLMNTNYDLQDSVLATSSAEFLLVNNDVRTLYFNHFGTPFLGLLDVENDPVINAVENVDKWLSKPPKIKDLNNDFPESNAFYSKFVLGEPDGPIQIVASEDLANHMVMIGRLGHYGTVRDFAQYTAKLGIMEHKIRIPIGNSFSILGIDDNYTIRGVNRDDHVTFMVK